MSCLWSSLLEAHLHVADKPAVFEYPLLLQVAGTEMGVTEPEATFSACYGGAFLMW
jgi:hypothetical protein